MKQRTDNRIAGFSLIEVIVGIAVLGLVTVPLCASLVLSVRLNTHSRDMMNAQLAASSMVETLMESGVDSGDGRFMSDPEVAGGYVMKSGELPEGIKKIAIQKDSLEDWYAVTVIGESNGQTVTLETAIRQKGGDGP